MKRRPARRPAFALCAHDVASPRIDVAFDGLRIAHLSDIHVRGGIRPRRLERAVEFVNQLKPDFVFLTGDYVSFTAKPAKKLTAVLKDLQVPAFATLGNHDHWGGALAVRSALEAAGIDVLQNESRVIRHQGRSLHVVGVDDSVTHHDDPEKAFAGIPADATKLCLSHDPKSADHLHRYGPAVIFSGHTHGGQVFFKKVTPYLSERIGVKYLHGFFNIGESVLYVTRGLGASLPVRFRAPLELAQLTLRSSATVTSAAGAIAAA